MENTKGFSLRSLRYLVMDEADRILNMDFETEVGEREEGRERKGRRGGRGRERERERGRERERETRKVRIEERDVEEDKHKRL